MAAKQPAEINATYSELDKRWQGTCGILFGRQVGVLKEFEPWLSEYLDPTSHAKSTISGKDVTYSIEDFCNSAKYASFDEVDFAAKFKPLNINEIKDIDSLVEAVQERAVYTGNMVQGNSRWVEKSSTVNESFYVCNSAEVENARYVYGSTLIRDGQNIFGCNTGGDANNLARCCSFIRVARCFETWNSSSSSDIYYSHNLNGCQDCIFCFNLRSKRNAIGNLALPKEEYLKLKKKLVAEFASELEKNKKLPSLMDLASGAAPAQKTLRDKLKGKIEYATHARAGKQTIEDSFSKTAAIVIGKRLEKIDDYAQWLLRHGRKIKKCKSAISGLPVLCPHYGCREKIPENRMLAIEESDKFGELVAIPKEYIPSLGLLSAASLLGPIAYFNPIINDGENLNVIGTATSISSSNCYGCISIAYSDNCAYSFLPRHSDHSFGCSRIFHSSFCIKCYNCSHVKRSFEVDNATNCSDCYFCHNVEGCAECLFCFNVKSKRYAIGNVEVGKENYLRVKKLVLGEIAAKIEKEKKLELDIYNAGCWKKQTAAR